MTLDDLVARVAAAAEAGTALRVRGGGSKDFYGGMLAGELLDVSGHRGILAYEPTELYLTARAGTPLAEVEAALAERGQMLPFEPPHFGSATVGGCVAAALAGPRRQQAGGVRDYVLGVRMIDGRGQLLNFGGQVMKNVAGFDLARLLTGSLGTLGVLAEVTFKVLPRPVAETTLHFELSQAEALEQLNRWGGQPLPISGSFWHEGQLTVRLSGAHAAVDSARRILGGEHVPQAEGWWQSVREQTHAAYAADRLWRLALPTTAPVLDLPGEVAVEWGGGLRWLRSDAEVAVVRQAAAEVGGHATLYRAPESLRCLENAFTPLPLAVLALHQRLKKAFDPKGIFNPGRLFAEV
ncbi:MAG TPA: glycolate oxidase subunit GlcE [Ilumatobacteraceae bacterium]|nr:glycolate oxidase subunit GlcE [Ilumatobacteraceae bacterium]